jgi:hypothetical protein
MHHAEASAAASTAATAERLRNPRASRRAERGDMLVASTLLLLLIAGWLAHFVGFEHSRTPSDFPIQTASRHA